MKNSLRTHNSKYDLAEEKISEIEDRSIETIQCEELQEKK